MGSLFFTSWPFLFAGAVCALGPVLIHLINRRRHRTVHWAAMDFLRRAIHQQRRVLNLRDWLLLAIRTLAVLLFGAAVGQPYFAREQRLISERQPIHAIVVLDNSLSMAYETLDGSLLELAKREARELIERLPRGSRITVAATCGGRGSIHVDALALREEALDALAKIELVDRSADVARVQEMARLAAEAAPELPKQIIFFSDQQKLNWQQAPTVERSTELPAIQCIVVRPAEWENTSVADLRVQDGLADMETPTTIVVEIAHQGSSPRRDLQVTLLAAETVLGQQTIAIEPGGRREVSFECMLGGIGPSPAEGQVTFLPITAKITPDRLPADDERSLSVPVVASLPVIFIDQVADEDEDVVHNRLGETRHLRKLLAPRSSSASAPQQSIKIRHLTSVAVSRDVLAEARLVVVAGVAEPGPMAAVLADYVRQGGQLLVAAGGDFDSVAWNRDGWLDGQGVLPLKLKGIPIGATPEEAPGRLAPFQLSIASLADEALFQLAGVPRADLESLYLEPFFFKAIEIDETPESLTAVETAELLRIEQEQNAEPGDESARWLAWESDPLDAQQHALTAIGRVPAMPATKNRLPRVLARYDLPGKPAFLLARQIGRGQAVFCSTAVLSPWNTLPKTNAVLLFDRLLRSLIDDTLPDYNLRPTERLTVPLPRNEQHLTVSLQRPGMRVEQPLDVSYVTADRRGVTLSGLFSRGVYRISGKRQLTSTSPSSNSNAWEAAFCVNGDANESDLTSLTREDFENRLSGAAFRWVASAEEIELAASARSGQNAWWWIVAVVMGLLAAEMIVIMVAHSRQQTLFSGQGLEAGRPKSILSRVVETS